MARNKKKKIAEAAKTRKPRPGSAATLQAHPLAENTKPEKEPAASPQSATPRRSVGLATCLAGMFLTLTLGVYLGTLLPGITELATMHEHEAPMPASAPPQAAKMEPELAGMVADLEKKANANPDSAADWINLGNIYFDARQPAKAIPAYERALKLAPSNADVLTDLGVMYREAGNYEKAIECFRRAIAINPRHENAMYNEGVVFSSDLKKKEEAIAAWRRLLEINPGAHAPNGMPVAKMIEQLR